MSEVSEWSERTVGDVVVRSASGPSPTCEERNVQDATEWGLLKTTAVTWAGWDQTAHKVPPATFWANRSIEVHPGDLLVTKAGPRHRVGVVVHVPQTPPHLMVSGKMVLLRPDPAQVVPSVLAAALAGPGPQKYLDHRTTGMAESQVNFSDSALKSCPVQLPPLGEQRRIAEILDTIDEAIQATERVIAKLLTITVGFKNDLFARLAADWPMVDVGETMQLKSGEPCPFRAPTGEFPIYGGNGINGYSSRPLAACSTIVIGRVGEYAGVVHLSMGPAWITDNALFAAVVQPGWSVDFLSEALQFSDPSSTQSRTGQPLVTQGGITQLRIPHPDMAVQEEAIRQLGIFASRVDMEAKTLQKLKKTRSGLLADLLSGRVRTVAA